jgi:ribosome-dependent ATPase
MAGPPEMTIAVLKGVSHRYGKIRALREIDLDIPAGCITGLIGPDGVGKSTLLSLIAGARRIQTGSVGVLGGPMADAGHRRRVCSRIAYMPQGLGRNLCADLSVVENIDFFGRLFGQEKAERDARIAELLDSTGLAPFPDRHAANLSGGMKQKLGLCCALVHDPDLLILDEPTTGVDPMSRRQFWELIDRMRRRRPGMSVLVSSAYMEEAERFDRLVMMADGRLLAIGSPEDLKRQTGTQNLEQAYIALLPEDRRRNHEALEIPPHRASKDGPVIEAERLTRRFGDFTAVDHVDFQIERGEIFGFIGPNGCGKTTTMKMLTGLLEPSDGVCRIFGREVDPQDMATRKRIGYMSQGFSLYSELTVRQNLRLHARLFHLPPERIEPRIEELVAWFGLKNHTETRAEELPLGIGQRLSLAVAVIHKPEILILDEPTSGVDPMTRDSFWRFIVALSRDEGITIFISTHYMNEAERCDRIAFMNAGQVLACDTPAALTQSRGRETLEEAFIAYLEAESEDPEDETGPEISPTAPPPSHAAAIGTADRGLTAKGKRLWAYSRRELLELSRDRIRLAFTLAVPLLLQAIFSYGISLDVENLAYAVLDRDRTPQSRTYLENFSGSRYFEERAILESYGDLDRNMKSGTVMVTIEIPPNFGKDLKRGRRPTVGFWIDGGNTFRAENTRGYVHGVHQQALSSLAQRTTGAVPKALPATIETRYRYNQDFKSIFAIAPGNIAIILAFIPAILTALGVVREKEMGSIVNFYVTPVTRLEFLLGKQLPYVAINVLNFFMMFAVTLLVFGVPFKGSFAAILLGAILFIAAMSGFGLLMSCFTRSQIAALFATLILTLVPSLMFSGLLRPVSSLEGGAAVMGEFFPTSYFYNISVGTFAKSLGMTDLMNDFAALAAFVLVFLLASYLLLRKQAL